MNSPTGKPFEIDVQTEKVPGKREQITLCEQTRAKFNVTNANHGKVATSSQVVPSKEWKGKEFGVQLYRYTCTLKVSEYAFASKQSPDCGVEEKWSSQVGGTSENIPGQARCLSCDSLAQSGTPEQLLACLRTGLEQIVMVDPRPIELRDEDLAAVAQNLRRVKKLSESTPVRGLQSMQDLEFYNKFLESQR